MGYDLNRFLGEVDDELTCPICSGVLEDPIQAAMCEHAFCRDCIEQWLMHRNMCPVDRTPLTFANLRPVPRLLRNLLSRLSITCNYAAHGCRIILKLDALHSHLEECEYDPKRPLPCDRGCGFIIPKDELKDHNCVRELRTMIVSQQDKMGDLEAEIADQNIVINDLKQELQMFKDFMNAVRVADPAMHSIALQLERDEIMRWSSTLPRAHVRRWGGMISTPDEALQLMIKRAISETDCPPHIVDRLMKNCHERQWPAGLSSLEIRQNRRRVYDNYFCRRIPGKQAILVLSCDNTHMPEDVIAEPGLVMIFALGIE